MDETALNGCSEQKPEIFTVRDTLWLLGFHDTHRVSCFKISAARQLYLAGIVVLATVTAFDTFEVYELHLSAVQ